MADWDADDFEPEGPAAGVALAAGGPSDKWDGEDEDDDVKDAWDAESEEEKEDDGKEKVVRVKKKKTLAQKIEEKEQAAEKARLERLAQEEADKNLDTPEGQHAEKLRIQKMTEQNDLKLAKEMMGIDVSEGGVIDCMNPETTEEFEELSKAVLEKFNSFEASEHFQDFAENFVKNLCMSLTVPTLKKVKGHVEAFHSTKLKEDKANAAKIKKGKPTKSTLKFDTDNQYMTGTAAGGYDDMDDFM